MAKNVQISSRKQYANIGYPTFALSQIGSSNFHISRAVLRVLAMFCRIFPPFSIALTANSPSLYIASDHLRPKISAARMPVVTAMSTTSLRRQNVLLKSFVPLRWIFSSSARLSFRSSSSDK
jgi:hypothetical protein